ncbi:MAG TPA: DUF3891 family protein [Terriglobales bacterium]|nr:DUF3891 family protein [Terriglobales bacterium]
MILRALELKPSNDVSIKPIWTEIERTQQQDFSHGCWLIPQPAHAALSGDIAARLDPQIFSGVTPELQKSFALHDSGWSLLDGSAIQDSRSRGSSCRPLSFMLAEPADIIDAWSGSIAIAGKASPIGGYLVSRHFSSIAALEPEQPTKRGRLLSTFITSERVRQQKLRQKLRQTDAVLDRLLQALQFCDLLSLYISCGVTANVEFPQEVEGNRMKLVSTNGATTITPTPFMEPTEFAVSAIRHPRSKQSSTGSFTLCLQ